MANESLKIALTFDVEANCSEVEQQTRKRFSGITDAMPKILDLFDVHGVSATWFIQHDYELEADEMFPKIIDRMKENGEVGCHVHFRNGATKANRYQHDISFQQKIIENATNALRGKGFPVYSFRGGANFFDESTLSVLEALNYKIDSSVIPGLYTEPAANLIVNHKRRLSSKPYYPSPANHCVPGSSKILEIPISLFPYIRLQNRLVAALIGRYMFTCQAASLLLKRIEAVSSDAKKMLGVPVPIVLTAHSYDFLSNQPEQIRNLEMLITKSKEQFNAEFVTLNDLQKEDWTKIYPFETKSGLLTVTTGSFLQYSCRFPFAGRLLNHL